MWNLFEVILFVCEGINALACVISGRYLQNNNTNSFKTDMEKFISNSNIELFGRRLNLRCYGFFVFNEVFGRKFQSIFLTFIENFDVSASTC